MEKKIITWVFVFLAFPYFALSICGDFKCETGELNSCPIDCSLIASEFYHYAFNDKDCDINFTITSQGGKILLGVYQNENTCEQGEEIYVEGFQEKSISLYSLLNGTYKLKIMGSGKYAFQKKINCRIDNTPPDIELILPQAINDSILVNATISDLTSGLSFCKICISKNENCIWLENLEPFNEKEKNAQCVFNWNIEPYEDGAYIVKILASDMANNTNINSTKVFLDRFIPTIEIIELAANAEQGGEIKVAAKIMDGSGIKSAKVYFNNKTYEMNNTNASIYQTRFTSSLPIGAYNILIQAEDNAGRISSHNAQIKINEKITWNGPYKLTYGTNTGKITSSKSRHVVFQDRKKNNEITYSKMAQSGELLVNSLTISDPNSNAIEPSLATDNTDNAYISWTDDKDNNLEIYFRKINSDAIFGPAIRVTNNIFNSKMPNIHVNDKIIIIWIDDRTGKNLLYLKQMGLDGKPLTQDVVVLQDEISEFKSILKDNNLHIAYKDSEGFLGYLISDLSGTIITQKNKISPANEFSFQAEPFIIIAIAKENIELIKFNSNLTEERKKQIAIQGESPVVYLSNTTSHIVWEKKSPSTSNYQIFYSKLNDQLEYYVDSYLFSAETEIAPEFKDSTIFWAKSDIYFMTTKQLEKIPPVADSIRVEETGPNHATISWNTNEPSVSKIFYRNILEYSNVTINNLTKNHKITLKSLEPSSKYEFIIENKDILNNYKQEQKNELFTKELRFIPALPTSFFGKVVYQNKSPAEGIIVSAYWTDNGGNAQLSQTITLTKEQTELMNETSLVGYFLFNQGEIKAKTGTIINITVPKMINNFMPYAIADPGGDTQEIINGPIIIDISPPQITIIEPQETTYFTTNLKLTINTDKELIKSTYSLNNNNNISFQNTTSFTAKVGINNLTVFATDKLGQIGSKTITFTIEDKVAPIVNNIEMEYASKITTLTSKASDLTNPLKSCEVCISSDGNCDSEWTSASNDFSSGNLEGNCIYYWDTKTYESIIKQISPAQQNSEEPIIATINFMATDETGNIGTGIPYAIKVDNKPPKAITGLRAEVRPKSGSIVLNWDKATETDFSHYKIYMSENDFTSTTGSPINKTNATQFSEYGLKSGKIYYYAVTTVDIRENELSQVTPILVKMDDFEAPIITIKSPIKTLYSKNEVSIIYLVNEQVTTCSYLLNNVNSTLNETKKTIIGIEGKNILAISCTDTNTNTGTAYVEFTIDSVPPAQIKNLIVTPVNKQSILNLNWPVNESTNSTNFNIAGFKIYRKKESFNDVSGLLPIKTTTANSYSDTNLESLATYYYAITAIDFAGNENKSVISVAGKVDDFIPPIITINSPISRVYRNENIALNYTVNEESSCIVMVNGVEDFNILEGLNTISIKCTDTYQNTGQAATTISVDNNIPPPVMNLVVKSNQELNSLTLSWDQTTAIDFEKYNIYRSKQPFSNINSMSPIGSATTPLYWDEGLISEEVYNYAITAVDIFGNENKNVISVAGKVADTIPPEPVKTISAISVKSELSILITWDESNSTDFSHYNIYRASSPFNLIAKINERKITTFKDTGLLSGKKYTYKVTAVDVLGNENLNAPTALGTVTDLIPPKIILVSPKQMMYNKKEIELKYSYDKPVSCNYTLNGIVSQETPTIIGLEGENTIKLICVDLSGNEAETPEITFIIDTIPPEPIKSLVVAAIPKIPSVELSWEKTNATDFLFYKIYISQAPFTNAQQASAIAITTSNIFRLNGLESHKIYYFAVTTNDMVENENKEVKIVSITMGEFIPPEITINSPITKRYGTQNIAIEYQVNEEVKWCKYSLNNIEEQIIPKNISAPEGINKLTITCSDLSDNIGQTTVSFEVDLSAPSQVKGLTVSKIKGENSLQLNWLKGIETDINHYNIYRSKQSFDNFTNAALLASIKPTSYKDVSLSSEEVWHYAVTAVDEFSNEQKEVISVSGKVADTIPPEPVSGLIVTNILGEITLKLEWNKSTSNDTIKYNIYRSMEEFILTTPDKLIGSSQNTFFYDASLKEGKKYHYAITAVDNSDNENRTVISVPATSNDITPPIVLVSDIGPKVAGKATFSAVIKDEGTGIKNCQICVGPTKECEWMESEKGFSPGDTNGSCFKEWDTTGLELTTYYYNFKATDMSGNSREGTWHQIELIMQTNITSFEMALENGWNLISFPLFLKDQSINEIFKNDMDNLNKIFYFEPTTQKWLSFNPLRGIYDPQNTLMNLEAGKAYWIEMRNPLKIVLQGMEIKNYEVELRPEWNYIGYPYLNSTNITTGLRGLEGKYYRVLSYDSTLQKYDTYSPYASELIPNTITEIQPGKGYLIDITKVGKWAP